MVKRIFKLFDREIGGLHEAAYLLGIFAFLSQLLGFLRDRLFASEFGAGPVLDAYYAAFRVPDLIFIVGASAVSLSVLIPFLGERLSEGKERARRFLDTVFSAFFLGMALISAVAYLVAPFLAGRFFPGFGEEQVAQTATLMRIMLLQPIFLGVSNLFASVTQLERRFFIYAASPILYNAGIIAGVLFLYPRVGVAGLAWGVALGALLHLAVQIPLLLRSG
ncbi:MAG: virulence factor, partial [Parcubacteria group bacterium Greene0416_79]